VKSGFTEEVEAMSKGILFDSTLCIGCKQCEAGCAEANGLTYDDAIAAEEKTSERKFTYVATQGETYMRRLCMHCENPSCVSVCPVGALEKTAEGPVTYDAGKCMGCRYCMVACPFDIPKYEWTSANPRVRKCILCSDRVAAGGQTACSEACPTGATIFGNRDELLLEARKRIRETPDAYLPHIYGEKEVGGTSVLFISKAPFGSFGLPTKYGADALPPLTGRVLEHVPDVVSVGFALLGGIYWITNRRDLVAAAEGSTDRQAPPPADEEKE
jgi:formate dehydrogenase iron-sulfur subunit